MNSILEKIQQISSQLIEKIQNFYEENKKLSFVILGMLFIILVCLILLVSIGKKNTKTPVEIPGQNFELTERLFVPDGPELPREYSVSRQTQKQWSDEEVEPYFTVPGEKEISSLATSNDNMINEIIGAAP